MNKNKTILRILELADQITPILAGETPAMQSAVLAELLTIWLAGHCTDTGEEQNMKLRSELLAQFCVLVMELTELRSEMLCDGRN